MNLEQPIPFFLMIQRKIKGVMMWWQGLVFQNICSNTTIGKQTKNKTIQEGKNQWHMWKKKLLFYICLKVNSVEEYCCMFNNSDTIYVTLILLVRSYWACAPTSALLSHYIISIESTQQRKGHWTRHQFDNIQIVQRNFTPSSSNVL